MSVDAGNNNAIGTNANSSLLQKFLNGDVDLRSIEQRDLRVGIFLFFLPIICLSYFFF
jgi:hypothetical protein